MGNISWWWLELGLAVRSWVRFGVCCCPGARVEGWGYQLCPGCGARGDSELQPPNFDSQSPEKPRDPAGLVRGVPLFWGLAVRGTAEWEAINHGLSSLSLPQRADGQFLPFLIIYPLSFILPPSWFGSASQSSVSRFWGFFGGDLKMNHPRCSAVFLSHKVETLCFILIKKGTFAVPVPGLCFPTDWKTWIIRILILTRVLCLLMEEIQGCSLMFLTGGWCLQVVVIDFSIRNHHKSCPVRGKLGKLDMNWSIS